MRHLQIADQRENDAPEKYLRIGGERTKKNYPERIKPDFLPRFPHAVSQEKGDGAENPGVSFPAVKPCLIAKQRYQAAGDEAHKERIIPVMENASGTSDIPRLADTAGTSYQTENKFSGCFF
jgi:hypothetical protein